MQAHPKLLMITIHEKISLTGHTIFKTNFYNHSKLRKLKFNLVNSNALSFINKCSAEIFFKNVESNGIFPIKIQFMNIHIIRAITIQLAGTSFKKHNWSTIR